MESAAAARRWGGAPGAVQAQVGTDRPETPETPETPGSGFGLPSDRVPHGLPSPVSSEAPSSPSSLSGAGFDADEVAVQALKDAGQKLLQARQAGVDVAKMTCVSKALGLAASVVGLGVAVAMAVFSGGAAAPLVVVAGIRLVQSVADARDARQCLVNARRLRDGEAIPRGEERPLGANSLGNLLHRLATRAGLADEAATRFATRASAVLSIGLSIVALATGLVTPALPVPETTCQWVNSGLLALLGVADAGITLADQRAMRQQDAGARPALQVFRDVVASTPGSAEDLDRLKAGATRKLEELIDMAAPATAPAGSDEARMRAALLDELGRLGRSTLSEAALDYDNLVDDLAGDPVAMVVEAPNRGAFGPDGGGDAAAGAVADGLLTTVFSVFENLPLPVAQGVLTAGRVAGAAMGAR